MSVHNLLKGIGLFVIALLTMIGLTFVYAYTTSPGCELKISRTKSDISTIGTALDLYKLDTHVYPPALHCLMENSGECYQAAWNGPYLREFPLDPWERPYGYQMRENCVALWSYGKDGQVGGSGDDADEHNGTCAHTEAGEIASATSQENIK